MALTLEPGTIVYRNDQGMVCQIDHSLAPVALGNAKSTSQEIALAYLKEVAEIYQLQDEILGIIPERRNVFSLEEKLTLRTVREKDNAGITLISFQQFIHGLSIWNTFFTVSVNTENQVIGSISDCHHHVKISPFDSENASYTPAKISDSLLKDLFLSYPKGTPLKIQDTSLIIYQYHKGKRLGGHDHDLELDIIKLHPIKEGHFKEAHYYVSTEILFSVETDEMGVIYWQIFISAESGDILFIHPFFHRISAAVFESDPQTQGCDTCIASSSDAELSQFISHRHLPFLDNSSAVQSLELKGEYIEIAAESPLWVHPPTVAAGGDFVFPMRTDDFACVSAYYQCSRLFQLMIKLGIDPNNYFSLTTIPLPVVGLYQRSVFAACTGLPQGGAMAILLGLAQDGSKLTIASSFRVILHEFGHVLLYEHLHNGTFGFAHSAGDALAAIFSDPDSKCSEKGVTFPFIIKSSPDYPSIDRRHDRTIDDGWAWFGPCYNTDYKGEQVLSSTLFRAYLCTGGASVDRKKRIIASEYMLYLIIQGCGLLSATSTDPRVFVSALTQADLHTNGYARATGLANKTNHKVIRWSFMQQGLFQPPGTPMPVRTIGQPPEVDIYINDGRNGHYDWTDNWTNSPAIWNRRNPDGRKQHEQPKAGRTNYLYVVLSNSGLKHATKIFLRGYQTNDMKSFNWPTNWELITPDPIYVSGPIAPRENIVVGPIEWNPTFKQLNSVLFIASNASDPSILGHATLSQRPLDNWRLVPVDNNIAQRTFP